MQTTATTSKRSSRSPIPTPTAVARAEFDAFRRQRFDATDADGTVDVEEYCRNSKTACANSSNKAAAARSKQRTRPISRAR